MMLAIGLAAFGARELLTGHDGSGGRDRCAWALPRLAGPAAHRGDAQDRRAGRVPVEADDPTAQRTGAR